MKFREFHFVLITWKVPLIPYHKVIKLQQNVAGKKLNLSGFKFNFGKWLS